MQDRQNPTIPSVEPPPHPNEGQKEKVSTSHDPTTQVQQSPTQAKETQGFQIQVGQVSPQVARPSQLTSQETEKLLHPKRGFPKIFLILFIVFVLLGVVALVVYLARSKGTFFGTENPNMKVKYQQLSPQDYRIRLTNSLASGEGPDIFEIHNSWPFMFKNELATLPASVMSPEEFNNAFYPVIVKDLTLVGEGIVAMPLEY